VTKLSIPVSARDRVLGLDPDLVSKEASSGSLVTHIETDIAGGNAGGVDGTPAFNINGESFEDWWYETTLLAVLEGALQEKKAPGHLSARPALGK